MNNSAVSFHQIPIQKSGRNRYASIALVALLHGVVIWALANGLTVKLGITPPPTPFQAHFIDAVPPVSLHVPRPLPSISKAVPQPQIPVPLINTTPDAGATTIMATATPQQASHTVPTSVDVVASAVTATHSSPPYPAIAKRLGWQGTVILSLSVEADGTITDAQVATSSGVVELDQAAVSWVREHWRYRPAMKAGLPVASTMQAAVKFNLKDAQ